MELKSHPASRTLDKRFVLRAYPVKTKVFVSCNPSRKVEQEFGHILNSAESDKKDCPVMFSARMCLCVARLLSKRTLHVLTYRKNSLYLIRIFISMIDQAAQKKNRFGYYLK